jgi:ParB/RepB/Spo0J family partition protein
MDLTVSLQPLAALKPSPTRAQAERRAHYDKASLADLAKNLAHVGLLQPIVARQVNGHLEIVAGERRWLAAKQASIDPVMVSVRELSDEQVIEVQLVENLLREDLHELAEAEGYEALQQKHHYSVEDIVAKVGKSRAYVYARLKLTGLCKPARSAFYDGKINATVALLLARIAVESVQRDALTALLSPPEELTSREAADLIQRRFMLALTNAPFDTQNPALNADAGVCSACPKNTLAQPELFADVAGGKLGVCTDPVCFASKKRAAADQEILRARAAGAEVIDGKAAADAIGYSTENLRGFRHLDEKVWVGNSQKSVKSLLGREYVPQLLVVPERERARIAKNANGDGDVPLVIAVARQEDIDKASRALKSDAARVPSTQNEAERKAKFERKFRLELYTRLRPKLPRVLSWIVQLDIAFEYFVSCGDAARQQIIKWWEWQLPKGGDYRFKFVRSKIAAFGKDELSLFLQDCLYLVDLQTSTWSDKKPELTYEAAAKARIDIGKLRAELKSMSANKQSHGKKAAKKK